MIVAVAATVAMVAGTNTILQMLKLLENTFTCKKREGFFCSELWEEKTGYDGSKNDFITMYSNRTTRRYKHLFLSES